MGESPNAIQSECVFSFIHFPCNSCGISICMCIQYAYIYDIAILWNICSQPSFRTSVTLSFYDLIDSSCDLNSMHSECNDTSNYMALSTLFAHIQYGLIVATHCCRWCCCYLLLLLHFSLCCCYSTSKIAISKVHCCWFLSL